MRTWGRLLAWSALVLVVSLIPVLIGWSHLPDPVATHWGLSREPDGRMPLAIVALLPLGIIAIGLFTTSLFRVEGKPSAEAVAMVGLMGGISTALMVSLVILNWDAPSWDVAASFGWLHIVGVLVGAGIGGWIGYSLGKRCYPPPSRADLPPGPAIEIGDDENVSWLGSASVKWPILLLVPIGIATALLVPGWFRLLGLLCLVLAFAFARVYVIVNDEGMAVRLGGVIPARRITLDQVVSSRSIDLEPAAWGGWGWRVSPGASAIVLRRGDAIEVTFGNDRRFAVTVDDAATGAALLAGLVARRSRVA